MPDDWHLFNTEFMLGESMLGQRRFVEAESFFSRSLAGIRSRFKAIPPDQRAVLRVAVSRVARLYESLGDKQKADQWRKQTGQFDAGC
jgi:hypothetical protein